MTALSDVVFTFFSETHNLNNNNNQGGDMSVGERFQKQLEIIEGEGLKTAAEVLLSVGSRHPLGELALERYAHGLRGRIVDPVLETHIAGISFENPVQFAAGWDKRGRAVRGLYDLGFAGGEIGTVLPFWQYGQEQPRLWTINDEHSVGLNRLGFNSKGVLQVIKYLVSLGELPCPIGGNVGKNALMPNEMAPWAHATAITHLYPYVDYFVLGVSSPNTKDLRQLQDKGPLRDNIQASQEAISNGGERKPLFIKIDAERSPAELDSMIEVVLEEEADGFVATNTYMGMDLKASYGERWGNEAGGLSGDDPRYRQLATGTVRYIYEQAGDRLEVIGVGGVKDTATAIEKMKNGASGVEVLTAIRPSYGRVAAGIVRGLLEFAQKEGLGNIQEIVGVDTKRGAKYPTAA